MWIVGPVKWWVCSWLSSPADYIEERRRSREGCSYPYHPGLVLPWIHYEQGQFPAAQAYGLSCSLSNDRRCTNCIEKTWSLFSHKNQFLSCKWWRKVVKLKKLLPKFRYQKYIQVSKVEWKVTMFFSVCCTRKNQLMLSLGYSVLNVDCILTGQLTDCWRAVTLTPVYKLKPLHFEE